MFKALISRRSESAINDAIRKLIKQIRMTVVGDSLLLEQMLLDKDKDNEDDDDRIAIEGIAQSTIDQISQSLMMMDADHVMDANIIFPDYVCKQNGIQNTLPVIQEYWQQHTAEHVYR